MLTASAALAVMQCLSVRPSVCLSCSWILSKWINISSIFSSSGSHTILACPYQTACQFSDGNPPNGGVECRCGSLKSRFSTNIWLCDQQLLHRNVYRLFVYCGYAGIGPSATRNNPQCETDQARSRTIHNHDRHESCVWQQGWTLRRRQQNGIELYALVNLKSDVPNNIKNCSRRILLLKQWSWWQILSIAQPLRVR